MDTNAFVRGVSVLCPGNHVEVCLIILSYKSSFTMFIKKTSQDQSVSLCLVISSKEATQTFNPTVLPRRRSVKYFYVAFSNGLLVNFFFD